MVDCAGVGMRCGVLLSSSITQSALPAVSAFVLSNKNFLPVIFPLIIKLMADDVPPPGAGVTTVMLAVPAVAMLVAGTVAVSFVLSV